MEYKVKCSYLNAQAKGVFEVDKKKYALGNLLADEVALVDVHKKNIKLKKILEPSKQRQKMACPYFERCGGCHMQHMTKESQFNFKMDLIKNLFKENKINPIIMMEDPSHYRHKVIATFSQDKNKRIIAGIYEEDSHSVCEIKDCMIQNQKANEILITIVDLANKMKYSAYDENRRTGLLRHVLIRVSHAYNEVLVCFVLANNVFGGSKNFVQKLREKHPNITTVTMNVNTRSTSVVLGNQDKIIYGSGVIKDNLCGLDFYIGAKTFYQVNPVQTNVLYQQALKMADLKSNDAVLDTYCGVGTISLAASRQCKKVVGVDINSESIKQAINNAKLNKISNAQFYTMDCSKFMSNAASTKERYDCVIMDPAREGSNELFLSSLVKLKPRKIVYVSCNPVTQKRDCDYLKKNGYKIQVIQPVDCFPFTNHVENIILMSKKEK